MSPIFVPPNIPQPQVEIFDTRLFRHVRRLLQVDAITVDRLAASTIDSEGDPTQNRITVFTGRGTLDTVSAQERLAASERGSIIDRSLLVELGTPIIEGDWVTVNGSIYEVVEAEDRRLARRALLRAPR